MPREKAALQNTEDSVKVEVISEYGLDEALLGLGLSYGKTSDMTIDDIRADKNGVRTKLMDVAKKLAPRENAHNKFLRCYIVNLDIDAPRYWWQEFDTYKVGTVANSESTMHTIVKREFTEDDFEKMQNAEKQCSDINWLNIAREAYKNYVAAESLAQADAVWKDIIKALPHAYLQRRIVTLNYQVLRTMLRQRKNHKLGEWAIFREAILMEVRHPEFLKETNDD